MPRPKEDRVQIKARVDAATPDKVMALAAALGYTYAGAGSLGKLLDAIAEGEIVMVKAQKITANP